LDISSVTDGSGDAFTRGLATSIYHNVSGSATYTTSIRQVHRRGTTSPTLNFSGGSTYLLGSVAEVAGLDPSAPLDQSGYHDSLTATAAWSSAAVTITTANEYLFSWRPSGSRECNVRDPASGRVIESQTKSGYGMPAVLRRLGHRIVSGLVTASSAQNYAMELVTFK